MQRTPPKLYTAYSVVNDFHQRNNVIFNWFTKDRHQMLAPPEIILKDLIPEDKSTNSYSDAAGYLSGLFLEEEVEKLRRYLDDIHHGTELYVRRISIPIDLEHLILYPKEGDTLKGGTGLYTLSKEDQYNLPIEIWAFYDLNDCPLTPEAQEGQFERRNGVNFLAEALRALNLEGRFTQNTLDSVVQNLYEDRGYRVDAVK